MSIKITSGLIASPGIKIGKAYVFHGDKVIVPKYSISDNEIESELKRFDRAVEITKKQIGEIQQEISSHISKETADIFTAHLMVLDDPLVIEKVRESLRTDKKNAEWTINDISMDLIASLSKIEDDYLKERIIDISDINRRIIANLQKKETTQLKDLRDEVIVFATDLTPSETALMNKDKILAFVTDMGGKTSHTSIMARALEIPAIVGTMDASTHIKTGDAVIVDAIHGEIIINPTDEEIKEFEQYEADYHSLELELAKLTNLPAMTLDGTEIYITGNIEIPEEMEIIKDHNAHGIGLYRTEFLFLEDTLPDEERQFQEYKRVIEFFKPYPVTIRTIDVGGDKVNAFENVHVEKNPFLGCRAIRFSLEHQDLFRIQLRAILRASHYGNAQLMFPMICSVDEFKRARSLTERVMEDLKEEGIPYDKNIPIGLMIEIPSAVISADILAKSADFFSVGTNDLVQYLLAVDRTNEKIAYLYNPLNLAFLRFMKQIMDAANTSETSTSICGELAAEPHYTMILLGLGYRQFSMSPSYIYQVKKIIRSVTIEECEELVKEILQLENTKDIEKLVFTRFQERFKDINL